MNKIDKRANSVINLLFIIVDTIFSELDSNEKIRLLDLQMCSLNKILKKIDSNILNSNVFTGKRDIYYSILFESIIELINRILDRNDIIDEISNLNMGCNNENQIQLINQIISFPSKRRKWINETDLEDLLSLIFNSSVLLKKIDF